MSDWQPGVLVRCREREWVVQPSPRPGLLLLHPLSGDPAEACGIHLPLGLEPVEPATFPPPDPGAAGDFVSGRLLRDAARLSFRSGAGPFRCLGRISVNPRPYQIVPLLMALRQQERVRLLIADDVGIGKTIEAGLIAREMLDRGSVRRLLVLCPPHLCDQWQGELASKFHIDAEVVRSATVGALERRLPPGDMSIWQHYPHLVVSIDFAKSQRRRPLFLQSSPDLVIVDEAHTAAQGAGAATSQQQRHQLLLDLIDRRDPHLLLLTATPHSGKEEAFTSLLGLLNPKWRSEDLEARGAAFRRELAPHFIQRRRADVRTWLGGTHFPERRAVELAYSLSSGYQKLFNEVLAFAREMVTQKQSGPGAEVRQRVRFWAALSLLRCVMSSPASAEVALRTRAARAGAVENDEEGLDDFYRDAVIDSAEEEVAPDGVPPVDMGALLDERAIRRLQAMAKQAAALCGKGDTKLAAALEQVERLLADGSHPIIYCRYVATADYVAAALKSALSRRFPDLAVTAVTGRLGDEERRDRVLELERSPLRVLVATDCLSEGINLQRGWDAVVHYDLPWNPNRLEQREGRVDRFGQERESVEALLLYGRDNPVDGAVLNVLLRKAREIHRTLGVRVPLPGNSQEITEAIFNSLLFQGEPARRSQLSLDLPVPEVLDLQGRWEEAARQEAEVRSNAHFSHGKIDPDEVRAELEETDRVLGDPHAVERFVRGACERLGFPLQKKGRAWKLPVEVMEENLGRRLGEAPRGTLTFDLEQPGAAEPIGRNHPLTALLASHLLDTAFDPTQLRPPASRCGAICTRFVGEITSLLLLRLRFMLIQPDPLPPLLAEELVVTGIRGLETTASLMAEAEALQLLHEAAPSANLSPEVRSELLGSAIELWPAWQPLTEQIAAARARALLDAHRRVRKLSAEAVKGFRVQPHLPADLLGLYLLTPE